MLSRALRVRGHRWTQINTDSTILLPNLYLGAVFEVSNTLGAGFLEKVYERALLHELTIRGVRAASQAVFSVTYK